MLSAWVESPLREDRGQKAAALVPSDLITCTLHWLPGALECFLALRKPEVRVERWLSLFCWLQLGADLDGVLMDGGLSVCDLSEDFSFLPAVPCCVV